MSQLLAMNYTASPYGTARSLSLGTHQVENFSNIYHLLRIGHLGTCFKFQVLPADDVGAKKRTGGQVSS